MDVTNNNNIDSQPSTPLVGDSPAVNDDVPHNVNHDETNTTGDWYAVEQRMYKGRRQYFVRWKQTEDTDWIERKDLTDAAVSHFLATRKRRRRRR